MLKVAVVALVGVLPGGWLVLGAWMLARIVGEKMRSEQGPQGRRLYRALAGLRFDDVRAAARRF